MKLLFSKTWNPNEKLNNPPPTSNAMHSETENDHLNGEQIVDHDTIENNQSILNDDTNQHQVMN